MKKLSSFFNDLSENHLVALITGLSVLLTFRVIYIQHGWINNDSVLYFEAARLFAAGEWKQGFSLYNWPLYSTLIALVHKATGMNIQHSAQLLNVFFFAITTYSFITLIRLAGGDKITIACGALLLFSSSYIVGDALPMLLRDQGFWAFFLTSLVFFIRFFRDSKSIDNIKWQLCAILAVLFRIEAITFLLALPFIFITKSGLSNYQRSINILKASSITIVTGLLMASSIVIFLPLSLDDFGRLADPLVISSNIYGQITQSLNSKAEVMGSKVLGSYIDDYAYSGLIATLVLILLLKSINSVGILAAGILAFTCRSLGNLMTQDIARVLIWVTILAVINASIIIFYTFILSTRYVIPLGFMMLIFASFGLASLIPTSKGRPNRSIQKHLVILILAILAIGIIVNILPKRPGYNYEQHAVEWVKTHARDTDKIFYSSSRERFYAGAPFTIRGYDLWDYSINAIETGAANEFDYLVINIEEDLTEKTQELIKSLPNYRLAKEFFAPRNKKKIVIFIKNQ